MSRSFPGATLCPICWDAHPTGIYTATYYSDMTHRSRECSIIARAAGLSARDLRDPRARELVSSAKARLELDGTPDHLCPRCGLVMDASGCLCGVSS